MEHEYEHRSVDPAPRGRAGTGGAWHAEIVRLVRRLWPERNVWLPGAARLRPGTAERVVRGIGGDRRRFAAGARPRDTDCGGNDRRRDDGGGGQRAPETRFLRSQSGLRVHAGPRDRGCDARLRGSGPDLARCPARPARRGQWLGPGGAGGWSCGRCRAAREPAGARSAEARPSDLTHWSFKLLGPLIILPPGARYAPRLGAALPNRPPSLGTI